MSGFSLGQNQTLLLCSDGTQTLWPHKGAMKGCLTVLGNGLHMAYLALRAARGLREFSGNGPLEILTGNNEESLTEHMTSKSFQIQNCQAPNMLQKAPSESHVWRLKTFESIYCIN